MVFVSCLLPHEVLATRGDTTCRSSVATACPDALQRERHEGSALIGPAVVEAILPGLPQILFMLILIELPAFLHEPEALQGDLFVLVAHPCEEVREDVRLV